MCTNGQVFSTPASGNLAPDWTQSGADFEHDADADHDLVLGANYTGRLDSLKWYNLAGNPLMTFADGSTQKTVTIEGEGFTEPTLQSRGNLHENGSVIPLQRIAIHTDNVLELVAPICQSCGRFSFFIGFSTGPAASKEWDLDSTSPAASKEWDLDSTSHRRFSVE